MTSLCLRCGQRPRMDGYTWCAVCDLPGVNRTRRENGLPVIGSPEELEKVLGVDARPTRPSEIELIRQGTIARLRGDELADRIGSVLGALVSLEFETTEQYQRRMGHIAIDLVAAHLLGVVQR